MKLSHGYSITADGHDPLVDIADVVLGTIFSEATRSGRWLVDVAPFRKFARFYYDRRLLLNYLYYETLQ